MADYILEITVDPVSCAADFIEPLLKLTTGQELQLLETLAGVSSAVSQLDNGRVMAIFSYQAQEHDRNWRTTALVTRSNSQASIRVEKTALGIEGDIYQPGKPEIVDLLLNCFYKANELPDKPSSSVFFVSTNKHFSHIEKLLEGKSFTELPAIYATKNFIVNRKLNPDTFAQRLYGLANVFVENDKFIGDKLKKRKAYKNQKFEPWPACIFWPEMSGVIEPTQSLESFEDTGDAFVLGIEKLLQQKITQRSLINETVWLEANHGCWGGGSDGSTGTKTNVAAASPRSVSSDVPKVPTNNRLVSNLAENAGITDELVLQRGEEIDRIENEALEMVLDAIQNAIDDLRATDVGKLPANCRRADVLKSVLDATSLPVRRVADDREKIKSILSGTRKIDDVTEAALRKMGIYVTTGGKHPKLTLGEGKRYVLTFPSSGSDVNGWKNTVTDVKKLFL